QHAPLLRVIGAGSDEDVELLLAATAEAKREPPFVDARNRVAHQIQRNLDALQIAMAFDWKIWLQVWSIGVSVGTAIVVAAILFEPADWAAWRPWSWRLLLVGVLGGFLSTVVRDLVTAVQGTRGRV